MPARHPAEPSLYDVLQVGADATSRDIARAYRRLARAFHPDARPADAAAAARFQAASDAYEVLSDPVRRAAYDQRRSAGAGGAKTAGRSAGQRPSPPSPVVPSSSPPPPPLWPLGPATAAPLASRPRGVRGAPVRPGPVRIEPLRRDPEVRGDSATPGVPLAAQPTAEARLLILAQLVRAFLRDDRDRLW